MASTPSLPVMLIRSSQFLPETLVTQREPVTNDPTPSLRSHYRNITTTTSQSASTPTRAQQALAQGPLLLFHVDAADQAHAAFTPGTV